MIELWTKAIYSILYKNSLLILLPSNSINTTRVRGLDALFTKPLPVINIGINRLIDR